MNTKMIIAREIFNDWRRDPAYQEAYDALADEFALADALIKARSEARLTQAEVAARMGTTQAVIARMEGGRTMPSTRTLKRFAEATGTRLTISFAPRVPSPVAAGE
jgi:ribosome-binding protein aMBF1 (putative translation factor)